MSNFISSSIYSFLVAFGVILGGSFFGGIGALINNHPPLKTMIDLANSIKIWAVATALGGTFSSFQLIEEGLFRGQITSLLKQIIYILASLIGANLGVRVIKLIQKCGDIWIR
ncbi:YtrH family sporulation protein [Clostridium brassicae]|uniref:YtrH family sporulation protein n=1 Tax=Clostridium brassicae TaxID=2999072 RepID=A0ABT4D9X2_9CLOT|nr:YtrH family sporulation protein [Clostridium brassicae]MCY6959113.1 YtrH family sporulation protein [Clostridium brassicae]